MLHFIKTQDSKPVIADKNGNNIVDFILKDVKVAGENLQMTVLNYYQVKEDDAMRPDLITQSMYGYMENLEGVLKMNEISNPFSIDVNEILYVFDVPSLNGNMRTQSSVDNNNEDIRNQYITPDKKSTVDPALRSFDKRNTPRVPSPSKGNQPALPPNYAGFGDQEIQIRSGKIVFGPNVTKQDQDCDKPLSKSEFISRLIKNRLQK
jgi:hypothetical protein